MSDRSGIFIAYCFAEKKWFDRVLAVLKPVVGNEAITSWDERKLVASGVWRAELNDILARRRYVLLMVSDIFLESDFVLRAKLPELLAEEKAKGLKFSWVLTSHCLYETAGLEPDDTANDLRQALDGLGLEMREIELARIADHVAKQLGVSMPSAVPITPPPPRSLEMLDAAISTRHESIVKLRLLARWLLRGALFLAVLAVPMAFMGPTHFLLLAGFAAFIACQALLVRARVAFLAQGLIGMRYTRSGLADETLPSRQRDPLVRRHEEFV
jgi:hypothetical protein